MRYVFLAALLGAQAAAAAAPVPSSYVMTKGMANIVSAEALPAFQRDYGAGFMRHKPTPFKAAPSSAALVSTCLRAAQQQPKLAKLVRDGQKFDQGYVPQAKRYVTHFAATLGNSAYLVSCVTLYEGNVQQGTFWVHPVVQSLDF